MAFCNICGTTVEFIDFGKRANVQCPICGSLERHRAVWVEIENILQKNPSYRILHVSPEKGMIKRLSQFGNNYYPIDINPDYPGIRHVADLTRLPYPDGFFDLIICCHTLDEVSDDKKAMSEMLRTLSPSRCVVITTYVNSANQKTVDRGKLSDPESRRKTYGSEKRCRMYGKDFVLRLTLAGFEPEVHTYESEQFEELNIKDETVFLCTKV